MSSQAHMDKMQLRQNYRNLWHSDLMSTMKTDTPYCCFALWCGPCVSYLLRKRALYNDMSRYVCCAGYMPFSELLRTLSRVAASRQTSWLSLHPYLLYH